MNSGLVPEVMPLYRCQYMPVWPENLHKCSQGVHNIVGGDTFAILINVCIDEALEVEECKKHMLGKGGVHPCIYGAC